MRKHLPVLFFIVACILNLYGKYAGIDALAAAVKPALMPLLALSTMVYALDHRMDRRALEVLVGAQLFGCAGDIFLLSDEFVMFASGIGAFLIGHIFYMSLFGGKSWKGLSWFGWVLSLIIMGGAVYGLIILLKVEGALLIPMAVYGMALMLLIFSTFCGVIRFREKGTWIILLIGSLLFTLSDSLIAASTFKVISGPYVPVTIMLTYLSAQSLLAIGAFRLARKN